ncbi:cytochrome bo3 quinol oxidase subunit 2 [Cupriavidus sp. YR651]|uniref:ubiquinol oxidase subunit II n=1 Tax=Cupriavidus sp. YR651 TaxID=1855315 RepID=UPI0008884781|nr:ubiquinol oxidase subunit II [Cupriavidus sp. YR651]SDD87223.1 cytochrome bo3 quinol oxidase subunit 2 [Cupriavidus sp. YR651]
MRRFDSAAQPQRATGRLLLRCAALGLTAGLAGCNAVLLSPSGDMAVRQRDLILIATCLMLLIIVPVIVLTLLFAWRYRENARNAPYSPEWDHSTVLELAIWAAPLLIIIALGAVTWVSTHQLDPYRPLKHLDANRTVPPDTRPLTVEVVAMDWKWLFLYPEQGIATVNELAAPVDRPIAFRITATSVMNAFFVPAMAGMVYAMPGMETKLHAVINKPGVYDGLSANYSGAGFSHMRFKFHGLSNEEFDRWIQQVKAAGTPLSKETYLKLAEPSESVPVQRFASVAPDLYNTILNRCVDGGSCRSDTMALDTSRGKFDPSAYICTASNTAIDAPDFAAGPVSNDGKRLLR